MSLTVTHTVAGAIRAEMQRQQITQRTIAEALDLTQQSVSRRLAGHVPFDVNELAAAARVLNVPLSTLLPEDDRQGSAA